MTDLLWMGIAFALYGIATVLLLSSLVALARTGVPVRHTPPAVVARALELAELKPGELLFDPGCGDGRVLRAAHRLCGARGLGYELSLPMWLWAQMRRAPDPARRAVSIRLGEGIGHAPADADAVYCFLMPRPMERVGTEVAPRLKPGARLVSYLFPVRAWQPERVVEVGAERDPLYLYRMPPRPA